MGGFAIDLDVADYVQRRIYYDCHERSETAVISRLLRPGDIAVDVGANIGYFTLLAAAKVGETGRVHAFEPVPANFAALEHNVRLNGFQNVILHDSALGASNGTILLGSTEADGGHLTSGSYTQDGPCHQVAVPVRRLDDCLPAAPPPRHLRLVKIDVEGGEAQVLHGFRRTLAATPPDAIVMEVNIPLLERAGSTPDALLAPLRDAGYSVLAPSLLGRRRPLAGHRRLSAPGGVTNILALRPGVES